MEEEKNQALAGVQGTPIPAQPLAPSNDLQPIEEVKTNSTRPACFKSTTQEVLFVLTATMAIAMGSLSTGSVTVISSFVGKDLDMTTAELTWISSASSLSSGAFLLVFGKVADLFGMSTSPNTLTKY